MECSICLSTASVCLMCHSKSLFPYWFSLWCLVSCYCWFLLLCLLTHYWPGEFLQKLTPVAGDCKCMLTCSCWSKYQQVFFALNVFIWNFVHVLLKPSNISLACDRQYSRHLCRGTEHLLQTHHFTAFPGKSRLSTFWQDSFLVLWVLFPLEYVLLFYLIVNKVDLWRGLFFKWEISWYVISYSFTVINLCL